MSIHQQYLDTIQECEEDEAETEEDEREDDRREAEDQREEEQEDLEEEQLRRRMPGRLSRSLVLEGALIQETMKAHLDPGPTSPGASDDLCGTVGPRRALRYGLERADCEGSEADGGKRVQSFGNMRRRPTSATRRRSSSSVEETARRPGKKRGGRTKGDDPGLFPQWLVNLMCSIEAATTHQLAVE